MDNSSYFSYINNFRFFVWFFCRKFIFFYMRYFNRYIRGRFDSLLNCMGFLYIESVYWVYSRNMFSCIWYIVIRGYEKFFCRFWYYWSFIWSRFCSNCYYDFIFIVFSFFIIRGVFRSFYNSDGYLCFIMVKRGIIFKNCFSRGVD